MPPRNPTVVQLDFPVLTADLIDQLNLIGQVGLLDFEPSVRPVFIVGSRGLEVVSEQPVFTTSQVFSAQLLNPGANAVVADTGQLPAGNYDIKCWMALFINTGSGFLELEHRNAGNTATLASWFLPNVNVDGSLSENYEFAIVVAEDERLRIFCPAALSSARVSGTIMARLRPSP